MSVSGRGTRAVVESRDLLGGHHFCRRNKWLRASRVPGPLWVWTPSTWCPLGREWAPGTTSLEGRLHWQVCTTAPVCPGNSHRSRESCATALGRPHETSEDEASRGLASAPPLPGHGRTVPGGYCLSDQQENLKSWDKSPGQETPISVGDSVPPQGPLAQLAAHPGLQGPAERIEFPASRACCHGNEVIPTGSCQLPG